MSANESISAEYRGWWRIIETSQWADSGLDILGPALLSLTGDADRLRMWAVLSQEAARVKGRPPPLPLAPESLDDRARRPDALLAARHARMRPIVERLKARDRARQPSRSLPVGSPGGKPGRNDPCPCGSGRKHKKCCLEKAPGAM